MHIILIVIGYFFHTSDPALFILLTWIYQRVLVISKPIQRPMYSELIIIGYTSNKSCSGTNDAKYIYSIQ